MKRPSLRFLASRKFWQRSAFALACLATLIIAAYAIENYRGEKVWSEYRAAAEARGVKLNFKDFIPPPIPDEENFAAIPIYRDLLSGDPAVRDRAQKAWEIPRECVSLFQESAVIRTMPDFAALRDCLIKNSALAEGTNDAVADVLRALEKYEPMLAQLRAASARSRSRLDGEWEKGFDAALWRMGNVMAIGQIASLRVSALLAKGRGREALLDWRAGYRHAGVFQGEPTLLACMLRVMLVSISTESVRRGLPSHGWSEAELEAISKDLAAIDLMSDFTFGITSERALVNGVLDQVRANPTVWNHFWGGNSASGAKWLKLIPRGWIAQNQWHLNEWYDQQIARAVASQDRPAMDISSVTPKDVSPPNFDLPQYWVRFPYWFVVASTAYLSGGQLSTCRQVQTNAELCLVTCALERFRLRHGDYPKELDELVPSMLSKQPRDRFDGQALRYRRTDDGGVILYSVGEDCRDDGGDDERDSVFKLNPILQKAREF